MKTFKEFYEQSNNARKSQNMNEVAIPAGAAASVAKQGIGRFIPGVGFVLGAADAVDRVRKGDLEGAAYSGLGAAANLMPVGGTAAQVALTGVQAARDYQRKTGMFADPNAKPGMPPKPVTTPPGSSPKPTTPPTSQQSLSLQNRSTLKPIQPIQRQQISQQSGLGGKVSTNTSYQSKLGGAKASTTYGSGGQQMVRANLGNQGVNKVASGQVAANKSFAASLGGVKGTVRYDTQGNKQFQALKPGTSTPKPQSKPLPKPAPKPAPKPQQKKFFGLF